MYYGGCPSNVLSLHLLIYSLDAEYHTDNVTPVGSVSGDRLMPTREMNVPLRRLLSPPCQILFNGKNKYRSCFGP